jgi:hypothetical protein
MTGEVEPEPLPTPEVSESPDRCGNEKFSKLSALWKPKAPGAKNTYGSEGPWHGMVAPALEAAQAIAREGRTYLDTAAGAGFQGVLLKIVTIPEAPDPVQTRERAIMAPLRPLPQGEELHLYFLPCDNPYCSGVVALSEFDGRDRLQKCSRCRAVRYCSSECQRSHWPEHRTVCVPASAVTIMQDRALRRIAGYIDSEAKFQLLRRIVCARMGVHNDPNEWLKYILLCSEADIDREANLLLSLLRRASEARPPHRGVSQRPEPEPKSRPYRADYFRRVAITPSTDLASQASLIRTANYSPLAVRFHVPGESTQVDTNEVADQPVSMTMSEGLAELTRMKDQGYLTEDEFNRAKQKIGM